MEQEQVFNSFTGLRAEVIKLLADYKSLVTSNSLRDDFEVMTRAERNAIADKVKNTIYRIYANDFI